MKKMTRALAAGLALVLAVLIAGCAGRGTFSSDINDETGAYVVTADDGGKGSAVASLGGGITIKEGQILVVSPMLEKGSVQIALLDADSNKVVDEALSGKVLSTYELEVGEYSVSATCNEDGTTGTVTVCPVDAAEFERQNQDLEALLSSQMD